MLLSVHVLGIFKSIVMWWHFICRNQECETGSIHRNEIPACLLCTIRWNTSGGSYDSCWCHRRLCSC